MGTFVDLKPAPIVGKSEAPTNKAMLKNADKSEWDCRLVVGLYVAIHAVPLHFLADS